MTISNYLCHLVGESPKRLEGYHASTITRLKTFAIAMHIPLLMWGVTGYLIASQVFNLSQWDASLIALLCVVLIYIVERIVIATPKSWGVNAVRLFIGLIMALIGASAVDLVIFQREVTLQLKVSGEAAIHGEHDALIESQRTLAKNIRAEWVQRQESANCEANGTCGSRLRSIGPIHRQLVQQAEVLRQEHLEASLKTATLELAKSQALEHWRSSNRASEQAGLLARIQALHDYIFNNVAAGVAWILFFLLILAFELVVVLLKIAFGSTVDDHIAQIREEVSRHRATVYMDAVTSPFATAKLLIATEP
ncbi:MAG: hypothetical protein JW384_03832 [Nitrosomonadaceae bacterium]|nr:hypothetical protein [Nitrosomonadaceae bacterium]